VNWWPHENACHPFQRVARVGRPSPVAILAMRDCGRLLVALSSLRVIRQQPGAL